MQRLAMRVCLVLLLTCVGCTSSDGSQSLDASSSSGTDATEGDASGAVDGGLDGVADTSPDDAGVADTAAPAPDGAAPVAFRSAEPEDFRCVSEMSAVRGFFVDNYLGDVEGTLAAAEDPGARPFPPGSIVQLIPLEAMVRLPDGTSPETGDWEYVMLDTLSGQSEITSRGFGEVENLAGSCNSCHAGASSRNFICEQSGLCEAAALPRSIVDRLVEEDARCE